MPSDLPVSAAHGAPLTIAIVCPCYNESEVLPISMPRLLALLGELVKVHGCAADSYIVLVDDGSRDTTWSLINAASCHFPGRVRGIRLSHNAGHQNALMAGLNYVTGRCDAAISMDVDLQDDLAAIPRMVAEYRAGAEIVLGVKRSRSADSWAKRLTAKTFYKGMQWMGVDLVENHADCRLLSSKALKNLSQFPEYLLFLRGLQPLLHSKIATVTYDLEARLAGQSKYNVKKMLSLAWNGITSFSTMPLRVISWVGALVFAISLVFAAIALVKALSGQTLPGWASITIPLYLLGGLIVLSIGIVGEYVAKIFLEVKGRPRFLIDEISHQEALVTDEQ
jgi:polyisoprenyl-phosphate glycosyltransferase